MKSRWIVDNLITALFTIGAYTVCYTAFQTPTNEQAARAITVAKAAGLADGEEVILKRSPHGGGLTFDRLLVSRDGDCYRARAILGITGNNIYVQRFGVEKCYPKNG